MHDDAYCPPWNSVHYQVYRTVFSTTAFHKNTLKWPSLSSQQRKIACSMSTGRLSISWSGLLCLQLGREHHGLKLITDNLEDVQYKVRQVSIILWPPIDKLTLFLFVCCCFSQLVSAYRYWDIQCVTFIDCPYMTVNWLLLSVICVITLDRMWLPGPPVHFLNRVDRRQWQLHSIRVLSCRVRHSFVLSIKRTFLWYFMLIS